MVACSNPVDAYWMIQQAIAADDPVIFFEPKRRYWEKAEVDESLTAGRRDCRCTPARVVREGTDVTVRGVRADGEDLPGGRDRGRRGGPVARGHRPALAVPAGHATPCARRCEKTGRLVVVHEAPVFLGMGAEIAARVTEQCFYHLEAPVLRVGGFDTPYPPSRLEEEYLPDLDRVLDAVDRSLAY